MPQIDEALLENYTHEVAVVEHDTERTVKSLKAASERIAEKIKRGMEINLDHRFYYVEIRRRADVRRDERVGV